MPETPGRANATRIPRHVLNRSCASSLSDRHWALRVCLNRSISEFSCGLQTIIRVQRHGPSKNPSSFRRTKKEQEKVLALVYSLKRQFFAKVAELSCHPKTPARRWFVGRPDPPAGGRRAAPRHDGLYVARAVYGQRARSPQRHLLARCGPVGADGVSAPVPSFVAARDLRSHREPRRDPAPGRAPRLSRGSRGDRDAGARPRSGQTISDRARAA